jgi:hypothetical protein
MRNKQGRKRKKREKMKEYKCCNKPDLESAYIWFWPFKGLHCKNCGEVMSDTGPVLDFIWTWIIWPFWDGRVKLMREATEKERKESERNYGRTHV